MKIHRHSLFRAALSALALSLAMLCQSSPAQAEPDAGESFFRWTVRREPRVMDTVRIALKHFRVHPEALQSLRGDSRARALLPILTGGYRFDDGKGTSAQAVTVSNPTNTDANTASRGQSVSAGLVWDLRELAFNPAQVQVYGLVGIQQDIMQEVVRTYFLRRQLQARLALRPPQDPLARVTLELRIEEYGAMLDAMTGDWFSTRALAKIDE